MKRLKSSDDLNSYGGEKGVFKDWGRKDDDPSLHQSSSHRSFHYKSESGKKGLSSSTARYERVEDERKNSRLIRKRPDYDVDSYERRKSYDRYRDSSERGILSSSPRGGYGGDRIHRSESFSGPRRDFPKGFRSERDRSRREGSVSSWRRFSGGKDVEEGAKSGSDSARGSKAASEEMGNVRSPQGGRDAKSPPWSKDSGSEQSRSLEVKKSESLPAESGNNSEREEGELEPDPEPTTIVENTADDLPSGLLNASQEVQHENHIDDKSSEDRTKIMPKEEIKPDQTRIVAEKADVEELETSQNVMNKVSHSSTSPDSSTQRTGENGGAIPYLSDNEKKNAGPSQNYNDHEEEARDVSPSLNPEEIKPKQDNDANLEVKEENMNVHGQVIGNAELHGASGVVNHSLVTKELTKNFKDKGKSVLVSVSGGNDSLENSCRVENEPSGFLTSREIDMEGPSTRGFDLFFTDPVKKPENVDRKGVSKPKDEKLTLEPLELSLRLPNVLLPIGSQNPVQAPDSPSQEMSIQSHASSFQTSSDGFTVSRSFSGSQHFTHNPSCSLTENSFDFEQSVGSRPLFQGVAWQVQPSDEQKNAEPPMHQRSLSNGNGIFHQSQTSQGVANVQPVQSHGARVAEGSYKLPLGLERQLSSNNKQPSGTHSRHRGEIRSPTQSVGSHETGSDYHKDRKRATREVIGTLSKSTNTGPADFVEPLLAMLVSDPLHIVARILNDMTGQAVASLKESVRDVILNPSKRRQLSAFRKALEKRSDITLEMLQKAHSVQVEILVALKTGIQDFLQTNCDISSSDLAEIFLNLRCRNLTCRSYLPVDECDCKICVQKNGFCSACMCLVCSKFDMASNTCSWVGCDVCLHWCHTDCGLRESYIRNGRSATGALGQTEMQFHCVACDHPSEMFGFVREVFQNFAKGWTAEAFSNELEYVRRIFSASEDIRGKRLHEISLQMLSRMMNKSDLQQVRSYIMGFLTDDDAFKSDNIQISQEKEVVKQNQGERSNDVSKGSQEAALWMKSIYAERQPQLKTVSSEIQRVAPIPREPVFDELDGIVRIKLAEAQMFQMRADDARREAEGLNRIAQAKNKKIEEEFASRVTKLHLSEAEEIRRQKLEELQALENAHQEYFNMKVRMEREIKDLLLKMEATKRNFN
ncbi:hypothetical protein L6452_20505 [Arctium lappa]|uniref:Uncharacterized protein n=1 Tax=Arctium lappa TaxID=4217 RepID=A0ACB9BCD6_ARCLA|nr:hypothetical protein L6452_20505 [Arctium lappa]